MSPFGAFILGVLAVIVSAEDAPAESKYLSSLYDSKASQFRNNTLNYEEFNKAFTKDGYYQFSEFNAGFNHYSNFPTLVVYQPDRKVKELSGYYFPNGLLSLLAYREEDPASFETYKEVREFFQKDSTEAVTPYAATYAYPFYYEYRLAKFVYTGEVSPKFAVVFLGCKEDRKEGLTDYAEVVKYFNEGKSNKLVEKFL